MKLTEKNIVTWFLRLALSAGMLSAVADRFGLWPEKVAAWGNWANFVNYTQTLNPLIPGAAIPFLAALATGLEVVLGILLLTTFQTKWVARASGVLLLLFALGMSTSVGIKAPLDYSVFCASAGAFALSALAGKKENQ